MINAERVMSRSVRSWLAYLWAREARMWCSSRMKSDGGVAGSAARWAVAGRTLAEGEDGEGRAQGAGVWFALSSVAILNSLSIWFAYFVLFRGWDKYV